MPHGAVHRAWAIAHTQHRPVHDQANPPSPTVAILHFSGFEHSNTLSRLHCMLLHTTNCALVEKVQIAIHTLRVQIVRGNTNSLRSCSCREHPLSGRGVAELRNQNNTGGRTVQVLPREAQVTWQIGAQRITIHKENNDIISLHHIEQAKQGAKHTPKNPPRLGNTHAR